MKEWTVVNREQTDKIFTDCACLFGSVDGIPMQTAIDIFGSDAVDFAARMGQYPSTGRTVNGYGIGTYTAQYLTQQGARIAATYCNIIATSEGSCRPMMREVLEYIAQATGDEKDNLIRFIRTIRSTGDAHDQLIAWMDAKKHVGKTVDEVSAFLDSIGA